MLSRLSSHYHAMQNSACERLGWGVGAVAQGDDSLCLDFLIKSEEGFLLPRCQNSVTVAPKCPKCCCSGVSTHCSGAIACEPAQERGEQQLLSSQARRPKQHPLILWVPYPHPLRAVGEVEDVKRLRDHGCWRGQTRALAAAPCPLHNTAQLRVMWTACQWRCYYPPLSQHSSQEIIRHNEI